MNTFLYSFKTIEDIKYLIILLKIFITLAFNNLTVNKYSNPINLYI